MHSCTAEGFCHRDACIWFPAVDPRHLASWSAFSASCLDVERTRGLTALCTCIAAPAHAMCLAGSVTPTTFVDVPGQGWSPARTPPPPLVEVVESNAPWLAYLGQWGTTPSPATQIWFSSTQSPQVRVLVQTSQGRHA